MRRLSRDVEAIHRAVNLWLEPIRSLLNPTNDGIYTPTIDLKKPLPEVVSKLNVNEKKKLFPFNVGQQKVYATFDIKKIRRMFERGDRKGVRLRM